MVFVGRYTIAAQDMAFMSNPTRMDDKCVQKSIVIFEDMVPLEVGTTTRVLFCLFNEPPELFHCTSGLKCDSNGSTELRYEAGICNAPSPHIAETGTFLQSLIFAMALKVSRVNLLPQFASKLMGIETQETSHDPRSKLDELLERKFQLQESQRELRLQTEKITSELESLHDQIDSEKYSVDGTKLPLSSMTMTTYISPSNNDTEPTLPFCDMDNCFDYSRCPVTSTLTFFLYTESGDQGNSQLRGDLDKLNKVLSSNKHRVSEPYRACVYIKLVESCEVGLHNLEELPHWDNEGENHVIWTDCDHDTVRHWTVGRAIIVSDGFGPSQRSNFDLIVGHWQSLNSSGSDTWKDLPLLFPVYRKFLLTYFGPKLSHNSSQIALENLQTNSSPGVHFQFCNYATDSVDNKDAERSEEEAIVDLMSTAVTSTLSDCSNHHARQNYVLNSTFSLMFLVEFGVNKNFHRELFGILKAGSVPVIFGTTGTKYLPFNEVLDWSKLVLVYPLARIPEIYHMLRSFSENDVLMFKQNGRLAFEKYFSTIERTVETALAVLRTRIGLAPVPYENALSPSVFSETFQVFQFPYVCNSRLWSFQ